MGIEERTLIDAWTEYWRTGMSGSCVGGPGLESIITPVWNDFVDLLPRNARVLDLATGNGIVARICAARARLNELGISIDAVDAAAIDPKWHLQNLEHKLQSIQFHAGVRLESLPFEDEQFTGIVSQFGFEYAPRDAASAETIRVLRPGGRIRLIMHSREGVISRDISMRLQRLQEALGEDGIPGIVMRLARNTAISNSDSRKLRLAVDRLSTQALEAPADDSALFYSREFLHVWQRRERYHPADLRRSLEAGWNTARNMVLRQEQMLEVACSATDMEALANGFRTAGLEVDQISKIIDHQRENQIAWLCDAHKPGGESADSP
jgi:ubiquinone/menaquinone biosynthesis C-methylase UbiE